MKEPPSPAGRQISWLPPLVLSSPNFDAKRFEKVATQHSRNSKLNPWFHPGVRVLSEHKKAAVKKFKNGANKRENISKLSMLPNGNPMELLVKETPG